MASFRLQNSKGEEFNFQVSEMFAPNLDVNVKTNQYGIITSINSGAIVQFTRGDIYTALPNIENGEIYTFINHPNFTIKINRVTPTITTNTYIIDPTAFDNNKFERTISVRTTSYSALGIYKNGTHVYNLLRNVSYYETSAVDANDYNIGGWYPITGSNEYFYQTLAMDFENELCGLYMPYQYNFNVNYRYADRTISSAGTSRMCTYLTLLPKNNKQSYPAYSTQSSALQFYNINTDKYVLTSDILLSLENNTFIASMAENSFLTGTPWTFIANPTPSLGSPNFANITGDNSITTAYQFYYWLLYDTDKSSNPYFDKNIPNKDKPTGKPGSIIQIGGNGPQNNNSDPINSPDLPTIDIAVNGALHVYKMSSAQISNLMNYLWTDIFFTTFIKLFTNPMEAIIKCSLMPFLMNGTDATVVIGNIDTNCACEALNKSYYTLSCGTVSIPRYYNDSTDYGISTRIYIPFYGYDDITIYEIAGATLSLDYNINIINGEFCAFLKMTKEIDGTNFSSIINQYAGNLEVNIPLDSRNYSSIISAYLSITKNILGSSMNKPTTFSLPDINITQEGAGTLGGNTNYLGMRNAYITVMRTIHNIYNNYSSMIGYPLEQYSSLSNCIGYTKCRQIFINDIIGTPDETEEIKRLLTEGVIF